MFDPVAVQNAYNSAFRIELGNIIAHSIGGILIYIIALIGLGWGIRKFQKHVSGKKF